ncbi:MAG: hypothetical protein O2887_13595 [Bacteroidetes bacterium]|nr:hypothetical protein [Bacteroidota bacterium]MDA1121505.1 hypothetical protein [Bacteroidota bacterium]
MMKYINRIKFVVTDIRAIISISDGNKFYELMVAGDRVSLMKVLYNGVKPVTNVSGFGASNTTTIEEAYYVKKNGETVYKEIQETTFVEEFREYFGDCESIRERIYRKELGPKVIREIMRLYNFCPIL